MLCTLFGGYPMGPAHAQTQSGFRFVSEFIHQLSEVDRLRARLEDDLDAGGDNRMPNCVRDAEELQTRLRSDAAVMRRMGPDPPLPMLGERIAALYERKGELYGQVSATCSKLAAGAQGNSDYGKTALELPRLTTELDRTDRMIFDLSGDVFTTLVDRSAGARGQSDRLAITNGQREQLLSDLKTGFGDAPDEQDRGYLFESASLPKTFLQKDDKGSDRFDETMCPLIA